MGSDSIDFILIRLYAVATIKIAGGTMARLPRFVIPGQPQHVIVRGNNRSEIFCADADYQFYLEKLKLACDKHRPAQFMRMF